jgi:hypothetical protein
VADTLSNAGDRSVLRWGGLAGIVGGVIFVLVFAIVFAVVRPDLAGPEGMIGRFPEVRAARTVENGLYLAVMALWMVHLTALYRALRASSPAAALFGSVLSILGLVVLAAGALPHVASVPLAELYHAPAATPEARATLLVVWRATEAIFEAFVVTGLIVAPFGTLALGLAMRGATGFGKLTSGLTLLLGAAGLVAAAVLLVDPASPVAVIGVFALIVFHLVAGWNVYRLSTATRDTPASSSALNPAAAGS